MKIRGNTVSTSGKRPDYSQSDPGKSDYILNKPDVEAVRTLAQEGKTLAEKALPKTGGTMTGPIAMGGSRVTGLGEPTAASDAANKGYVDGRKQTATATLTAAGWSGNTQTVSVGGVTASNTVIVAPDPAIFSTYTESGIRCTAQASGTLTFVCEDVPAETLTVNVVILA